MPRQRIRDTNLVLRQNRLERRQRGQMRGKVSSSSRSQGGRTAKPVRAKRTIKSICRPELIARREQCIAAIAQLQCDAAGSRDFAKKALQLLTTYWSTSSWRVRGDILRTAEWLIAAARKNAPSGSVPPQRIPIPCLGQTRSTRAPTRPR